MPTRNVVITDHQAALVERLVTEGRYQNASEVLREGLRLVEEREKDEAARLDFLRQAAAAGDADLAAGRVFEIGGWTELRRFLDGRGQG